MSTLIIDLGCSNLKFILYKGGDFDHFFQVPTPLNYRSYPAALNCYSML